MVGLWNGGHNYSWSWADDAEWINSIGEAMTKMRDRRNSGGHYPQEFRYVFKVAESTLTPNAHDDNSGGFHLYRIPDEWERDDIRHAIETDGMPDYVLTFGPRGGIRVNNDSY